MAIKKPDELSILKDQSFILTFDVTLDDISVYRHKALTHLAADLEIKGFRKGKVPLDLAAQHLSVESLISEALNQAITVIYSDKIRQYDLKPIVSPQIRLLNPPLSFEKEWQIELTSCQLPQIELGDYKAIISQLDKTSGDKSVKTTQLLDAISSKAKLQLPPILLKAEIENRLSQLIDQTAQAGITVDQYLKSKNLTLDQYQDGLRDQLTKEWTINLSLDQIAQTEKIEVDPQEIQQTIKKYPQQKIDSNMLRYLLRQQKTIDFLLALDSTAPHPVHIETPHHK